MNAMRGMLLGIIAGVLMWVGIILLLIWHFQ